MRVRIHQWPEVAPQNEPVYKQASYFLIQNLIDLYAGVHIRTQSAALTEENKDR